ncbi:cytochrome c biogenesis protein [Geobacter grbiciae]|uniref:cytochrome c biogenesis protein n=1 Tax=Geobacter grbiciae TaxID=155042 RepID=UPI001C017AF3|nr:cytochrome c biogenesis protein CcsA [Geobacter grbiciae]MBT1075386.1 cytochrome c biogenesis protein CcsA [Geobacter grbiciae]
MFNVNDPVTIDVSVHWVAVIVYVLATIANVWGVIFTKEKAVRLSYSLAYLGLAVHGVVLLYRWVATGHGPYMARYEILSSNAWVLLVLFLVLTKVYPKIKVASIVVFPATFLLIALGLFFSPEMTRMPPSMRSIWLVLHVLFYKISVATILVALAFSLILILKTRTSHKWLERLPSLDVVDIYAYRFAGFSFVFWAIAMLAGSIWAYQLWGRFWGWDPVETWSLITWGAFGMYLHLRRFFGWKGERAAYFYILCTFVSIVALYFTPLLETSIHSEYFK